MISATFAIHRARRDSTVGFLLRTMLATAAAGCLLVGPVTGLQAVGTFALLGIGAIWMVLSYRSLQGSQLAAASPMLIASGHFDEAEAHLETVLRTFSIFRNGKLLALHNLALLRHAERRYEDTVQLCRALLRTRLGSMHGLEKSSRLLLANSLLEINELRGAHDALQGLTHQRLSLIDTLNLQLVQLDYLARIGAWEQLLSNMMTKVQLAELMPAGNAARSQALMAMAALRVGRMDIANWLRDRAALLADSDQLISERPMLSELWPTTKA